MIIISIYYIILSSRKDTSDSLIMQEPNMIIRITQVCIYFYFYLRYYYYYYYYPMLCKDRFRFLFILILPKDILDDLASPLSFLSSNITLTRQYYFQHFNFLRIMQYPGMTESDINFCKIYTFRNCKSKYEP